MSAPRDPDVVLASWLDDGPADLPSSTRRAISTAVRTTPQARIGPIGLPAWRPTHMSRFLLVRRRRCGHRGGRRRIAIAMPRPSGVISVPAVRPALSTPSPSPFISTVDWLPFSSTRYGYESAYPPVGLPASRPEPGPWTTRTHGTAGRPTSSTGGTCSSPRSRQTSRLGLPPMRGSRPTSIPEPVGQGSPPPCTQRPITLATTQVDGHPVAFWREDAAEGCAGTFAFVVVDGRMHVFSIWRSGRGRAARGHAVDGHLRNGRAQTRPRGRPTPRPGTPSETTPRSAIRRTRFVRPTDHGWSFEGTVSTPASTGLESFTNPATNVRVNA